MVDQIQQHAKNTIGPAAASDFLSCISDWNPTQHWLEMTMATIR